jgi:hypothetical protein
MKDAASVPTLIAWKRRPMMGEVFADLPTLGKFQIEAQKKNFQPIECGHMNGHVLIDFLQSIINNLNHISFMYT